MAVCQSCGVTLGPRNRTGYCRHHVSAALAARPGYGEKISRGLKQRLQRDPVLLAIYRNNARAAALSPACNKARIERWHREGETIRQKGVRAARTPEVRERAGRTNSARRLSWCPPHLRQQYLDLMYRHHIRSDEARRMIEEQEAAEIKRWRRRHVEPGYFEAPV